MHRYGAILSLFLMVFGCASARMTSVTDPAGKGKRYQRFIVFAKVQDLDMRGRMEHRVVARLEEAGAEGASSLDLLPPTREYSEADITSVLWARGIEALLVLSVNEPESRPANASETRTEHATRPLTSLRSELFDVLYQRRAWASIARTKTIDDPAFETVAPYCDKIVEQMLADNMLSLRGR